MRLDPESIAMNSESMNRDRRFVLAGLGSMLALGAAGCTTMPSTPAAPPAPPPRPAWPEHVVMMYRAMPEEEYPIPAIDLDQLDPRYWCQRVDYPTPEKPGTVIVDTAERYLYHVEPGGTAMRYGVGIGRAGFSWSGRAHIAYK